MDASARLCAALADLPSALDSLPQPERRRAHNLIARAADEDQDGWRSILVELMDRPMDLGWTTNSRALAYLLDERRTGRLRAWRQGAGSPSAEQQARLRMLWLIVELDELMPGGGVLQGVRVEGNSPRNRYGFGLIDLLRQGDYELIAELAAKQLASSSSLA